MTAISSTVACPVRSSLDDPGDEHGRLAGARAGLDAQARAEIGADALADGLVDRDEVLTRSPRISAKLWMRGSSPFRSRMPRAADVAQVLEVAVAAGVGRRLGVEVAARDAVDDAAEDLLDLVATGLEVLCR